FTYVIAGWEGSAHDSRILNSNFYRGDASYGVRLGIISPYHGVRYHLNEFSKERPPENDKELFNLRHSSLRTTIERGFGILKKRNRVLHTKPFWSFATQVDVVLACCVIHNHIENK
ncbi:LOW QUALITY PROTEIN: DDE_4 domain-containing protein, partial [Cephalotus follicularis]